MGHRGTWVLPKRACRFCEDKGDDSPRGFPRDGALCSQFCRVGSSGLRVSRHRGTQVAFMGKCVWAGSSFKSIRPLRVLLGG